MKSFSLSNLIAGLVATTVGFTSSIVIIFQAATAIGATPAEISSWLLVLGLGAAVSTIGFSLYYRMPILTAWSTPGAALLVTSLAGVSMPEAIGAFVFSAMLMILAGVTGFFEKMINYIPRSLSSAMLAGILLHFGTNIFVAMQGQLSLVLAMFMAYLIGKRFCPRFVVLLILFVGVAVASMKGLFHVQHLHVRAPIPLFTMPQFSIPILISVGIPLFVVTMTSQGMPGIAVLQSAGYKPPVSPIVSWSGVTNLVLAPFGGFAYSLAAITAAICLGKEADVDPAKRYKATICAGLFYLLIGLFGATVVTLFSALPNALVMAIAGLALIGTISNSLKTALENDAERESAIITLLVTASGLSLFGVGAAFWGLVAGMVTLFFFRAQPAAAKNRTPDKQLFSPTMRTLPSKTVA
jgi:benzoate membrane transport protein